MRVIIALVLMVAASTAHAVNVRGASVNVAIHDAVTDGCWTNLREVREYVEEKLYSRGARIKADLGLLDDNAYRLYVSVTGGKIYTDGSGPCIGAFGVRLDGLTMVKGEPAWAVFKEETWIQAADGSLNAVVNSVVNQFFREIWPR